MYTDRFCTSFTLAGQLLQSGVHLTGTVQKNRVRLPPEINRLRLGNLYMKMYQHPENVMALGWQDRRWNLMLSTWHKGDIVLHHCWRNKSQEDVNQRVVSSDYTAHLGAIDHSDHYCSSIIIDCSDHYCSSYTFTKKTLRSWRKLFFRLIEMSLVNSFLIYKKVHHLSEETHLRYRNELIAQLVGNIRNHK